MGIQRVDDIPDLFARHKLRERGYIYVDETGVQTTYTYDLPDRGWYLYLRDDGKPLKLRLTDRPYDGPHVRTDVNELKAVNDEYGSDGTT